MITNRIALVLGTIVLAPPGAAAVGAVACVGAWDGAYAACTPPLPPGSRCTFVEPVNVPIVVYTASVLVRVHDAVYCLGMDASGTGACVTITPSPGAMLADRCAGRGGSRCGSTTYAITGSGTPRVLASATFHACA